MKRRECEKKREKKRNKNISNKQEADTQSTVKYCRIATKIMVLFLQTLINQIQDE